MSKIVKFAMIGLLLTCSNAPAESRHSSTTIVPAAPGDITIISGATGALAIVDPAVGTLTISWSSDPSSEGTRLFWKAVDDPEYVELDVGDVDIYDLAPLPLVPGTRYEFYMDCYAGDPRSFSDPSDILRWTF